MEQQKQELRAYFFANMYLPSLHAGIQSQHTTTRMFVKYQFEDSGSIQDYPTDETAVNILYEWAENYETTIVLNGGMSGDLEKIKELLSSEDNPYPWSFFNETGYALNGALTNVGIILPEKIYNYHKIAKDWETYYHLGDSEPVQELPILTDFEVKVAEVLLGKRLMY